jgi:signal transduction histidine kinase
MTMEIVDRIGLLSDGEQARWQLDQLINERGAHADVSLIDAALGIGEEARLEQIVAIATALLMQMFLIVGLLYERHRRRYAEATSRQHLSELAHMNRSATAGELSASIAHEIKQLLGAIAANGSAALRWLAKATPDLDEARAALERIVDAARHGGAVIDTIRSMFRKKR